MNRVCGNMFAFRAEPLVEDTTFVIHSTGTPQAQRRNIFGRSGNVRRRLRAFHREIRLSRRKTSGSGRVSTIGSYWQNWGQVGFTHCSHSSPFLGYDGCSRRSRDCRRRDSGSVKIIEYPNQRRRHSDLRIVMTDQFEHDLGTAKQSLRWKLAARTL
jgi:hypothetical protein